MGGGELSLWKENGAEKMGAPMLQDTCKTTVSVCFEGTEQRATEDDTTVAVTALAEPNWQKRGGSLENPVPDMVTTFPPDFQAVDGKMDTTAGGPETSM